jgi:lipopolysaccharide/colanic/teichoic acid biosynthesis glycosyltransferase
VGLHGRPFDLLKFRSMRINSLPFDDVTEIREGHPLVTPVGKWIRRLKIDELPQLINVLRGDMALIGPRPSLPDHVEKYDSYQRRRLRVRPGMTGWGQVNGSIELTWPERVILDVWYVDHRSFWIDASILWRTVAVIVFGERRNPKALNEAIAYTKNRCMADCDSPLGSANSGSSDCERKPGLDGAA